MTTYVIALATLGVLIPLYAWLIIRDPKREVLPPPDPHCERGKPECAGKIQ